jgi:all-trans-retinol 13,14-reductase
MKPDYLIIGSGLSALVFGALMAKAGKTVHILEAHEYPGGFGHTFTMAQKYTFNAQLHYVWDCGEGDTVNRVLKKLNLAETVTFERYDPNGFDHMRMPGYALDIPADSEELIRRLSALFPDDAHQIRRFIREVQRTSEGLKKLAPPMNPVQILAHGREVFAAIRYLQSTLQEVFYAWVILFTGYQRGAFYPTQHFEQVIQALVQAIEDNDGKILFNQEVTQFKVRDRAIVGVQTIDRMTYQTHEFAGETVICNMDPQKAAKMIGLEQFSQSVRRKLAYEYSPSNFMAYCVVKGLDLRNYGFGAWNVFHTGHPDLNEAFAQMYVQNNFSNPSFAITTPTLLTGAQRDCPEDCQIIEFLTVANYEYFKTLQANSRKAYARKKEEILEAILDVVEAQYVPNLRQHLVFKITGSPTTNERFCWCPRGNSYGSSLTPRNMGLGRLNHETSLKNFYFCNASSGYPGFAPTFWTGAILYQRLSGEQLLG